MKENQVQPARRYEWTVYRRPLLVMILFAATGLVLHSLAPPPPEAEEPRYYVEDQVIVTGPAEAIDGTIDRSRAALIEAEIVLTRVERLNLTFLGAFTETCPALPDVSAPDGLVVIDQYKFTSPPEREAPVQQVIGILEDATLRVDGISSEPNYLTGRPPEPVEGDPWSIAGSPWSIAGSPWSKVLGLANQAFRDQWAFGEDGIDLGAGSVPGPVLGQDVHIGVFDTSPFPATVASAVFSMTEPLELNLVHPMPGGRLTADPDAPDVSDHGLFVSGLVHGVAPQSEIYLIRVLDDTAQGDLQTLNKALVNFITQTLAISDTLDGVVINLSLGVHSPTGEVLPSEITSLDTILSAARCFGMVVVAASGNDSAGSTDPLPPQIPAEWESTIGVAASNIKKQIACFSNFTKTETVLAPGGDGKLPGCIPALDECVGTEGTEVAQEEGGCPLALISLSLASDTGYGYWNGTSFSAPLVSGLAALLYDQEGETLADVLARGQGVEKVEHIRDVIENNLVGDVVNVEASLAP
jgi:hypothetical protein